MIYLCFLVLCSSVTGFNVDVESGVVHRRPPGSSPDSMFGFTVQLHVHGSQKMLLVGAPEDDTRRRPEVERPGSVYRCEPTYTGQCREVIFDSKGPSSHSLWTARFVHDSSQPKTEFGLRTALKINSDYWTLVFGCTFEGLLNDTCGCNTKNTQQRQVEEKSHQWFGATLTSTGNGPIVACAPRYVSFVTAKLDQRNPVGSCYVASTPDGAIVKEVSPCRTSSNGQRLTGQCQAGFSAAVSEGGSKMFLGAPGSFYWQGRTFSIDPNETFPYYMQRLTEGQLYSFNPDKPTVLATGQDSAVYDDSYMGYSIAAGAFGEGGAQAIAVGVPRGSNLRGLVVLYTMDLQVIRNISGSQIGAYFGYCLASGDIDGDGFDDVIIGAPMFTRGNSDGYEHGIVYVVYQGRDRSFQRNHYRMGDISKGRFGLAVTSLGDINLDGFGDLAVGAPYSGKNGRGVVFIYYGSAKGLRKTYSQAIAAEDVNPYLTTFGFSLSGGVDLDMNNFTDLAVGAYKSESVVFFRSRPVIKVNATIELYSYNNALKEISLDDRSCSLSNGTQVGCATMRYCLTYDAEDVYTQLEFKVIFDLDSAKKSSKRLYIMYTEGRRTQFVKNILLTKGHKKCGNATVYLIEEIRDKLTPLEIAMSYDVITQRAPNTIPPILDQTMENVHMDSLSITKNCGSDNVCIPDLQMAATTSTVNYILGSDQKVDINVEVENTKEDAFEAAYYLHIPPGVSYNKMQTSAEVEQPPVYCYVSVRHTNGSSTLKCDIGNPLASGRKVSFRVTLEVDAGAMSLEFDMETNATNPENGTYGDNRRHMSISVVVEARLLAIGTSDPPELYYNASLYRHDNIADDRQLGPQVIHKYNIKNEGPFAVQQAQIVILWPYQTLNDENLMYMLVEPQTVGPVVCYVENHINPSKLLVKEPYHFYLQNERSEYMNSEFGASASVDRRWNESETTRFVSSQGSGFAGNDYNSARRWENSGTSVTGFHQEGHRTGYDANSGHVNSGTTQNGNGYFTNEGNIQTNRATVSQSSSGSRDGYAFSENGGVSGGSFQGNNQNQGQYGTRLQGQNENTIIRQRNRTIVYDSAGNVVSETESSTEFSALGHEGEAGSSFSRRYGATDANNQGQYQSFNRNQQYGSNQNRQDQWTHAFDSSASNDQRHSWSTEETVNRDIMNAGSRTYQNSGFDANTAGLTVVGGGEDDETSGSFGANAALNPSNNFRTSFSEVSVGGASQGGQSGSRNFETQGGSFAAGGSQGGSLHGGNYAGSRSNSGSSYSYSSSSGSRSGGSSYSYGSRSGGASTDWNERRENTRKKRQIDPSNEIQETIDRCQEKFKCAKIICNTDYLAKGQDVWIALRTRFNASVLNEITKDRAVTLSTMAIAQVIQLPLVGIPTQASLQKVEAQTVITQQLEALSSGTIPLWVVILAAVVGALLLLLLIFALYKCGFFKRNRPSDTAERQPLNGRDEHL